jgi:hypothetical protein
MSIRRCAFFIVIFSAVFTGSSYAQQKQTAGSFWENLIPQLQKVLGCTAERRVTDIVASADVTGDGVPEALVAYCNEGAYTATVALIRLEENRPVPAKFRDSHHHVIQLEFLMGASVRNGEATALDPAKHAVYSLTWHTDDNLKLDKCRARAFVWTPRSATFDESPTTSKELAKRECARLRRELPTR